MATTDPQKATYDLLIVTDATASMGGYLGALRESIPEILALARLSGAFSRLGVLAYKDYSDPEPEIVSWSGWNAPDLSQFVRDLNDTGGGDFPEAAKTALIRALQAADKHSRTLVLWYSDAPPHHKSIKSVQNDELEAKAFPTGAVDWVKLCHTARRRNCSVFCFTPRSMEPQFSAFYVLLAELTGGICIGSKSEEKDRAVISRLTLGVIIHWTGRTTTTMSQVLLDSSAVLLRFEQSPLLANPKPSNEDEGCRGYLPPSRDSRSQNTQALRRIVRSPLDVSNIPVRASTSDTFDLAKRFLDPTETDYRDQVYKSLRSIIQTNVASLAYNSIFGQLWRAVCKDTDERKTYLVDLFSEYVGEISDTDEKAALRQWLEDSFDRTEEIEGMIQRYCGNGPTPSVYLDFDADVQLTRTELLEVSWSCYGPVLKKIARIFTNLKLVEPGITLGPSQRSIPLALPVRDFYRILPHLIIPGTLYAPRAAALTAVVALVTGVPFLKGSATALLATVKGKWLDLDVPENISFECARFLLSAPEGVVLTAREKRVYEAMRRYRLLELNLDAPVNVRVPWTPQKTRGPGDVKVQCTKCLMRRSITIMSHKYHMCGICVSHDLSLIKIAEQFPEVDEEQSCWVECSSTKCRAQYVVENPDMLKIRPRCHYCRNKLPCPWIECSVCKNRIIVSPMFRRTVDTRKYSCPACVNPNWGRECIVSEETTVRALNKANGVVWLGFNNAVASCIFDGKSAFKLMQAFGEDVFGRAPSEHAPRLLLDGKTVCDTGSTLGEIEARVGRGEVALATCALCFDEMPRSKLLAACGRTGCNQLVDEGCLQEWYGRNEPGKLLNMMQLTCPFCRRKPTVKTLARYNPRVVVLGGLQAALDDRRFLYAWCTDCACAKQAYERTCCMEASLPPTVDFRCIECRDSFMARMQESNEDYSFLYAECADCGVRKRAYKRSKPEETIPPGFFFRCVACSATESLHVNCPNERCGIPIQKIAGCNHMSCICGTHFCYACGKEFSSNVIYSHMNHVHGSIFGD
ncbi:hypothetical protein GGX14DRAFT_701594 [Mycena pura]|uniref:RING-type domain-containing protein n=1 Tax=Mycena pura TaxID=153505 RepID=A0AAD6UND8_9AGAR|nr:hypothetical protein GGX14DRAFT_701594 [Mycena pura]